MPEMYGGHNLHILAGDFNARIIDNTGIEDKIGPYIYNQGLKDHIQFPEPQIKNRTKLINWVVDNGYVVKNIFLESKNIDRISFRHTKRSELPKENKIKDHSGYGQLGYVLINNAWKITLLRHITPTTLILVQIIKWVYLK